MSKNCAVFCFRMLVAFCVCVAGTGPAWSGESLTGDTITLTGKDNTEAKLLPEDSGYTVQLEEDAALNVTGKDAAVSLGSGGEVMLSAGSHIGFSQGESLALGHAVSGVKLTGKKDESSSGENRVVMEKGSDIAVDGSVVVVHDDSKVRVSGIGINYAASAVVSMDGATVGVAQEIVNSADKTFYTYGIDIENSGEAAVALQGGAQVTADVAGTGRGGVVDAWGVFSKENTQFDLHLLSGAKIIATVKRMGELPEESSDDNTDVQAVGVAVFEATSGVNVAVDESMIKADASSAIEGQKALAAGVQLANLGSHGDVATMRIENGSQVAATAHGSKAFAVGGAIMTKLGEVRGGKIDVASGSCISAQAIAEGTNQATAAAAVLAMQGVKNVDISISDATVIGTMKATAVNTGAGVADANIARENEFNIFPAGLGAVGYDSAKLHLVNAKVIVTAEATARADQGESFACVGDKDFFVSGLMFGEIPGDPNVNVNFAPVNLLDVPESAKESGVAIVLEKNSSISVNAEANAGTKSEVYAAGVQLLNLSGDVNTLSLDGSTVLVDAKATATDGAGSSMVEAMGILVDASRGTNTLSLNNATVAVKAEASDAKAVGIEVMSKGGGVEYTINLENNSRVSALAHSGGSGGPDASGAIFVTNAKAVINIDHTSELHGVWAVKQEVGDSKGPSNVDATVNNHGLIDGRLDVNTLHNSASGILQVALNSAETFKYDCNANQDFYFKTQVANLDAGTTFRFLPGKGVYSANKGQSIDYALLEAAGSEAGKWNKDTLILSGSPLLGLSWSGDDANKLIAHIKFQTPAEAGLSSNATGAVKAAMADMPSAFVFGTDPESWSPNVNGAFLSGMTQTVGASHSNIGNRLGGLMGLNSGDEVVASGGLWYNASFTDADQDERGGVVGFDADTTGLSLGLDRQVGPLTVGAAFTQGKSEAKADDKSSEMDMNDSLFSLYGSYDGGAWFGEAVLSAGMGDVDSVRRVGDQAFAADYDSTSYNAIAKAGVRLRAAGWEVNPLLTVEYSFKDYDSYTESGGKDSGALEVDSQDYTVINVGGGTTLQRSWLKGWGVITPEITAMVRYDLKGDGILTTAKFVGGSTAFVARGADPAETSWELSTAMTLASLEESALSVRLGYDYAGREDFAAHSVSGKVRFEF